MDEVAEQRDYIRTHDVTDDQRAAYAKLKSRRRQAREREVALGRLAQALHLPAYKRWVRAHFR